MLFMLFLLFSFLDFLHFLLRFVYLLLRACCFCYFAILLLLYFAIPAIFQFFFQPEVSYFCYFVCYFVIYVFNQMLAISAILTLALPHVPFLEQSVYTTYK